MQGLSSFTADEISKIKGQHSNKIGELLGYITKSEVVHKDDMVEFDEALFKFIRKKSKKAFSNKINTKLKTKY